MFRHKRRGLVGLKDSFFGFGFFSLWFDVLLLVRNAVLSLSLSLGVWFLFYCVSVGGVTTVAAAASLLLLVKTLP